MNEKMEQSCPTSQCTDSFSWFPTPAPTNTCASCGSIFTADELINSWTQASYDMFATRGNSLPHNFQHIYMATITKVIDGDTVVADVGQGFGNHKLEKLRLVRLDPESLDRDGNFIQHEFDAGETTWRASCPDELAHGKLATKFVERMVLGQRVPIITRKSGKYGRFLADIILHGDFAAPFTLCNLMHVMGLEKRKSYETETNGTDTSS